MKSQAGFSLMAVFLTLGVLAMTTVLAGVIMKISKVLPPPSPVPVISPPPTPPPLSPPLPPPTPSPAKSADPCSGLNEKECLASLDCTPVYGPSCPVCTDERYKGCRKRLPEEISPSDQPSLPISCQRSADCPPVIGVCVPGNCPTWRCINGRCVFFKDANDARG